MEAAAEAGGSAATPAATASVVAAADTDQEDLLDNPPSALDAWIAFNLDGNRLKLDQEGLEIAKRQDACGESRKNLAASTRAFKKVKLSAATAQLNADPTDLSSASKAFSALLKQYQAEVDTLTTRAKAAESAFLGLYKALYEVPDPVAELKNAAADKASLLQLKEELRTLRSEHSGLAERNATASKHESRIVELEKELKNSSTKASEEVKKQVEERQAQWLAAQQNATEAYEMREQELLHQLTVANDERRRFQLKIDAVKEQRDAALSQLTELKKNRAAGAEMAAEDSERALSDVKELRRRCAQLEVQINVLSADPDDTTAVGIDGNHADSDVALSRTALSAELAARDVEVSRLRDQVEALEGVLSGKDDAKSEEFARLSASIKSKDDRISSLLHDLEELPTKEEYETMKRQFDTLQAFQLSDDVNEAAETSTVASSDVADTHGLSTGPPHSGGRPVPDLERRLLDKLKVMENKLTTMRVEVNGKDSRVQELSMLVRSLEERNDDQKALIAKLEEGINAITGDPSSARTLKARATISALLDSSNDSERGQSLVESDMKGADGGQEMAWNWGEHQQAAGLQKLIAHEPTMLDIVSGQRDRFRARTLELEDENRKVMERLERVTGEVDNLKSDNVQLYERIRYLQSYTQENATASRGESTGHTQQRTNAASASAAHSSGSMTISGLEDDSNGNVLNQYRSLYEDMMNPLALFHRRERHKRMSEMSAPERLTLRASQRALRTKSSRIAAFCYVLVLHVFVFVVLATSSGTACPDPHTLTTNGERIPGNH